MREHHLPITYERIPGKLKFRCPFCKFEGTLNNRIRHHCPQRSWKEGLER